MAASIDLVEQQIREKKKDIAFDMRDFTVDFLVHKFGNGSIYVPDYQQNFVWQKGRQSKFIESVILGFPIPIIFLADVREEEEENDGEGKLEIVDGVQRIRTLTEFVTGNLELKELDILTNLKNKRFSDLSVSRQRRFLNTALRMIILTEESDPNVRALLFERINSGSVLLTDMEKRKDSYPGQFTDFIYNECTQNSLFQSLTEFTTAVQKRGEAEELILRFFAYSDQYPNFQSDAYPFLNSYLENKNKNGFDIQLYRSKLDKMLKFVNLYFPNGFIKSQGSQKTPRVRFEAISVGTLLALEAKPDLKNPDVRWLNDPTFIKEITGSSTSSPKWIRSRIEYVKNKLLGLS